MRYQGAGFFKYAGVDVAVYTFYEAVEKRVAAKAIEGGT